MAFKAQIKYVRPPIRTRACCAGPGSVENIPYFVVVDDTSPPTPPPDPSPEIPPEPPAD